jgi:hypothetical protein
MSNDRAVEELKSRIEKAIGYVTDEFSMSAEEVLGVLQVIQYAVLTTNFMVLTKNEIQTYDEGTADNERE